MTVVDDALTPAELVSELDRYIIGQHEAKRAVAIAIRNRWRRRQLPDELRDEVLPKNIIMIGPTGVGKTEIARRLAQLVKAPFIKVEASKYTEVGYVGRDVESIIRDLVAVSISLVKEESRQEVAQKARAQAEGRLVDLILAYRAPGNDTEQGVTIEGIEIDGQELTQKDVQRLRESRARERVEAAGTHEAVMAQLRSGQLEELEIEYQAAAARQMPHFEVFSNAGVEQMGVDFQELLDRVMPSGPQRTTRLRVSEARPMLEQEAADSLIDQERVTRDALERVTQNGIVFLDELDKIAGPHAKQGPDVSREGVQRDLLPIVEGSSVNTRYGIINTDHILFIAAGAFHVSKPSDLIPELQGRFPIRVELSSLSEEDFVRILTEPENALTRQYTALLATEGVDLAFTEDGIAEIAQISAQVNRSAQNIGARRLATVLEKILEDISFDAPGLSGERRVIDQPLVRERLKDILADEDLSRYIL